jgi:hypothetical protein
MDLSKAISYRGLNINDVVQTQKRLIGFSVENVDYSSVQGVGYTEKRAAGDGLHASDVYLGPRQINLRGLIYATTKAELFDRLHVLKAVFSPTSAYQEAPGDKGFLPLTFTQPTLDVTSFPGGNIPLFINARPLGLPQFSIDRDRLVSSDHPTRTTALPWQVSLFAADPRMYVYPEREDPIAGAAVGTPQNPKLRAINRGDYETPLNVMLVIGSTAPAKGQFVLSAFGTTMIISILAEANRIYRYRGTDRVLTVQDSSWSGNPEVLRMDLLSWTTKSHNLMVPARINPPTRPFYSEYTYTCTAALAAGSRLWWNEAFA